MSPIRRVIAIGAVGIVAVSGVALAQTMPHHRDMMGSPEARETMRQQHPHGIMPGGMMPTAGHAGMHEHAAAPTMPGQDAFGAIQEIVRLLDADPKTDWSKVNLEALRQHLIDMNEVTLKAEAAAKPIDGGLEIAVTGAGRTIGAIQRMVAAHARELDRTHLNGWNVKTGALSNGVTLTVTAGDPKQVARVRGLGFIGIMASGAPHQPHHLAMATGAFVHAH